MKNERGNVKLSDIAKKLDISTVSVSKALSGKGGVSDELRQRIFDTAEEMGYSHRKQKVPDTRTKQYIIGVIVAERYIRQDGLSFYMSIYQEIALAALDKNCITMLEVISRRGEEQYKIPDLISDDRIDGIIVLGEMKRPYTRILKDKIRVPLVFLDCYEDIPETDFIISDSFNGMYSLTKMLIKEGYTKIGFVGKERVTSSIADRFLGYRKALLEMGTDIRDDWQLKAERGSTGDIEITLPEEMPEAFVCHCDVTAKYVIEALNKNGCRVPEDIGIVGFDNYLPDKTDNLELTTYDVDIRKMARAAVDTIARMLENAHFSHRMRIIDGRVIEGNSHKKTIKGKI